MRIWLVRATEAVLLLSLLAATATARVVRVEILSRADVQDGKPFGRAGAYERITGRVYFRVNPSNIHNRQIVDLAKADHDAANEVEFSADLYLLKPKDMKLGNGSVLFEVSNRGGKGIVRLVNGVNPGSDPSQDLGDGFLMRQGYTVAWLGWQFDVADQNQNLKLYAPVAHPAVAQASLGAMRKTRSRLQEQRFVGWCVRILPCPHRALRCRWDIFFLAPRAEKVTPLWIRRVRKMCSPCAIRQQALARPC